MSQVISDNRSLTDRERQLIERLFSDPTVLPIPFKAWLVAYLEASDLTLPISSIVGLHDALRGTADPYHYVGAVDEPPFQNGYENYGLGFADASYRFDGAAFVVMHGLLKGPSDTVAFTLPPAYRPGHQLHMATVANDQFAIVRVATNGEVRLSGVATTAWVSIDNIRFQPGA